MSESAGTLAGDLALCHPKLRSDEVRAVAQPIEGSQAIRLTVVAADRRGLLADSAAVLAFNRLSILDASAATWPRRRLGLHSFVVESIEAFDKVAWTRLGEDLRAMVAVGSTLAPALHPVRSMHVDVRGADGNRSVVRVAAPDQLGLLSSRCHGFALQGVNIESLHARRPTAWPTTPSSWWARWTVTPSPALMGATGAGQAAKTRRGTSSASS
jgi:glycine cleavage system regulatory protein